MIKGNKGTVGRVPKGEGLEKLRMKSHRKRLIRKGRTRKVLSLFLILVTFTLNKVRIMYGPWVTVRKFYVIIEKYR